MRGAFIKSVFIRISDGTLFSGMTKGRRRNALAFFGGMLMTLTLPPVFLLPLLIPAFCILYLLIDGATGFKRAFADGWWWGMGWHVTGLYWFCIALLTDPEKFAWLIPFALIGLNAIIALYAAFTCGVWKLTRCRGVSGVFLFSVLWALAEYLRGHLFSGFPWNMAGYAFAASDGLLQIASLVGAYGMTWIAVFLAVIPVAMMWKKGTRVVLAVYLCFFMMAGWGYARLVEAPVPGGDTYDPPIRMRLVQAAIDQNHKWDPQLRRAGVEEHIRLTRQPGIENISIFIWPETAIPYIVQSGDSLLRYIGEALPANTHLIAGTVRMEGNGAVYNSMLVLNHRGDIVGSYDKARLVPFGEFVPFRAWLPKSWLTPAGDKDFSRGAGAEVKRWPMLPPVMPLICYEAVFPQFVAAAAEKPAWLLNLTNDAWFGRSSGPHQHFHMARVRAVEQGVPLVRVANTGITALVDAYGRVISKMGQYEKGFLDISITTPINNLTTYNKTGKYFLWWVALAGMLVYAREIFFNKR